MKHRFRFLCIMLSLLFMITILPVSASAKDSFYDTSRTLLVKSNIETDAGFSKGSSTVQGGCTDGKYAYFIIHGGATRLLKFRMKDFKLVDMVDCIGFGHANDITYNSKVNRLVVTNNAPNYDMLTVLNPDTLEVTSNKKIKLDVYSISYDRESNQYFVGISGTYDFAVLDSKFNVLKKYSGVSTGYTRQGCDSDDDYVYFVQGDRSNIVMIYSKSGKLVKKQTLPGSMEVENIFHVGTDFYVTFHYHGNFIYRIGLSKDRDISYTINYDANGGKGSMKATKAIYGEDNSLSKCTFTNSGYIFAGWYARRDNDDTYLGYTKDSDENEFLDKDDIYEYTIYKDETNVSKTARLGSVTMYAVWAKAEYLIRYDSGDADEGEMPGSMLGYFMDYTVPANQFTRNGYIFTSFRAQRTYDGRYLGYSKDCSRLQWLDKDDISKYYEIKEGESLSRLTYGGSVTLTPNFKSAYTYNDAKTSIIRYDGIDSEVNIPEDEGVYSIAQGAFNGKDIQKIRFKGNISEICSEAFTNCPSLKEVSFINSFPDNISPDAFKTGSTPCAYLEINGNRFFLGWFVNNKSPELMKVSANRLIEKMNDPGTGENESTSTTEQTFSLLR